MTKLTRQEVTPTLSGMTERYRRERWFVELPRGWMHCSKQHLYHMGYNIVIIVITYMSLI